MLPELVHIVIVVAACAALAWTFVTFRRSGNRRWLRLLSLGFIACGVIGLAIATSMDRSLAADGFERGGPFAVSMLSLLSLMLGAVVCAAGVLLDARHPQPEHFQRRKLPP